MAGRTLAGVLGYLRRLARTPDAEGQSDAELLRRFAAGRDEGAFAALLQRHGPLVLGVCRQVLRDPEDAEDAFQATFLVLARKAAAVRRHESVSAWLYRVASNLAADARRSAARRRARQRQAVSMAKAQAVDEHEGYDWQPILHEEVNRLPARYRVPVVLCYLQGKTHQEAARELRWPVGTVKGRLARARDLLRARLVRRGLALSAAGLAAALAEHPALAAVSTALLDATLKAALLFAAGKTALAGLASLRAVTLAKGALKTMATTKLTLVTFVVLAAGAVGTGGATFAFRPHGETRPGEPPKQRRVMPPTATLAAEVATAPAIKARADDGFGPEVKGLQARVTLPKEAVEIGKPILVEYVVRNVSEEEQVVWHSGFWPNHQVLVRDANGKTPALTPFGEQCRKAFAPGGERGKNVPVQVPVGGEDAAYERYDLTRLYDLSAPGRYTVEYVYEEKQGGWEGRLPSNEAAFRIVPRNPAGRAGLGAEGLQVTLASNRKTYPPGEPVDLTLAIKNNGKEEFSCFHAKLQDLNQLTMTDPDGNDVKRMPNPVEIEFAGTRVTVRPGEAVTVKDGLQGINLPRAGGNNYLRHAYYPMETPGVYRLRIRVGNADSNELEVKVVGREESGPVDEKGLRKEELRRLEGTWHMVACEEGGKPFTPGNMNPNDFLTFSGTTFFFQSGKRGLKGDFTIDPSKTPRWMDQTSGDLVFKGIYEWKGDKLRLFLGAPGGERPAEFKTKKGENLWLRTYERVKAAGAKNTGGAESKPVHVNDVDFQAVIDAKCPTPAPGEKQFVDLGLRLTNRGDKTLLFNLYDTLRLGLRSADGKKFEYEWVRLRTAVPEPARLKKGETRTVYLDAYLKWRDDRPGRLQLGGTDPTGGFWNFDGIAPGKYLLHVEYENTDKTLANFQRARRPAFEPGEGEAFWLGKATTDAAEFEVTPPAKPGKDPAAAPVGALAGDLDSGDGAKRVAATRELLRRGKAVLKDLEAAGAREVVPVVAPTEKQPATRRLDLVYSLIRGLPRVDARSGMGIRQDRITLRLEKGVTRAEFDRMARQYRFGLHFERRDMFRPDAATVCDVVTTQTALEPVLTEILTTAPRVETISLIVPLESPG